MLSCSDTVKEDYQYIRLDQAVCSFYSNDNQPIEIQVQASPSSWKAVTDASWLEAVRNEDGTILTITAADNESESERTATISITAGDASQQITVTQLGFNENMPRYRKLPNYVMGAAMSPNGRFVGGFTETLVVEDDSYIFHPTIIDLYTGEETVCMDVPQSMMALYQTMVVSDAGYVFITDGQHGVQYAFGRDGDYFEVEGLPGFRSKPEVQGTSSEGNYWVGFATHEDGMYHPLVWIDGQPRELQFPDKAYRGQEFSIGIMARGVSADGSVIYGTTWESKDVGMVYWTDINAKPEYVGKDIHTYEDVTITDANGETYVTTIATGMIAFAELTNISPSGTWIAGKYRSEKVSADGTYVEAQTSPAFYNTETEKTTIVDDYGESTGVHVTDDGIAFIGLGTMGVSDGVVHDLNTDTPLGSTSEWILENYGISTPAGYIQYLAPDKRSMIGSYAMSTGMGVSFCSWYIAPPLE